MTDSVFGPGLACQAEGQSIHHKISISLKVFTEKPRVKMQGTAWFKHIYFRINIE